MASFLFEQKYQLEQDLLSGNFSITWRPFCEALLRVQVPSCEFYPCGLVCIWKQIEAWTRPLISACIYHDSSLWGPCQASSFSWDPFLVACFALEQKEIEQNPWTCVGASGLLTWTRPIVIHLSGCVLPTLLCHSPPPVAVLKWKQWKIDPKIVTSFVTSWRTWHFR